MGLHGEGLAVDKVLTRMMEMELGQRVAALSDVKRVAASEIELDGVAVVDDCLGPLAPVDRQCRLPRANRGGDIDR